MSDVPLTSQGTRPDTRTYDEFLQELEAVGDMPLVAKLSFLRNARNRDRAMGVPTRKLARLLNG